MLPLTKTRGDLLPYAIAPHTITPTVRYMSFHCKLQIAPFSSSSSQPYPTVMHSQTQPAFITEDDVVPKAVVLCTRAAGHSGVHIMRTIQEKSKGSYSPGNRSYCD
ncbi:hypothetical protein Zmor_010759 [Zophobas morio]|uniref:Uncharacterized protein n=1 Tax=Zophobas morio TaxID=2755281 RepID=A0AA38IP72_9CUCU|nr:hypothetical protein Zmor_010759 [Zophobas morio]